MILILRFGAMDLDMDAGLGIRLKIIQIRNRVIKYAESCWTILKQSNAQIFECKLELEIMVLCQISQSISARVPKTVR